MQQKCLQCLLCPCTHFLTQYTNRFIEPPFHLTTSGIINNMVIRIAAGIPIVTNPKALPIQDFSLLLSCISTCLLLIIQLSRFTCPIKMTAVNPVKIRCKSAKKSLRSHLIHVKREAARLPFSPPYQFFQDLLVPRLLCFQLYFSYSIYSLR